MATTSDKGKEREKEAQTHGSTLFVSNLPYTATSVDLQTLFSDIAPVRSAFVVTEQGTGISKGVGYVSFALKEDADSAFETISRDGINLVGRKLRIQWAETKKHKDENPDSPKKESKPKPHRPQPPRLPHDPLAIRTIVISGLPTGIDSKVLWKKIRKYAGAETVDWPVRNEALKEDPTAAHVLFSTAGQALDAVNKLHAHVYKGSLLSVTLKKRLDVAGISSTPKTSKATGSAKGATTPSHASRLIIRNIPFNATEQDIRATFLPYGPIYSIHIPADDKQPSEPKKEEEEPESTVAVTTAAAYASAKKPRTKGFAFVWMLSKKDAEKAIEGCNGIVMRAGTAKTIVEDKQKKKKERRLEMKKMKATMTSNEGKQEDGDEVAGDAEDEDMKEKDEDKDTRATERVIAVDWALSKNKWEEEKAKIDVDVDADVEMDGSSDSDSDSESSEESSGDSGDGGLGLHGSGSEVEDGSDSDADDREEAVKPELPPPETGTTVFMRNLPFDATEDELRTLFRSFGPLRYARITLDPATGRSRGTGFACFWNKVDADRAVQQSELLQTETTGKSIAPKKNPFSLPSILTPDPSSSLAQSLVLHGRTLDVVKAVTRDTAGKYKEDNERARQKADKRNMYLLREGVIMPNSPAASTLTPAEVERRTTSFNSRRALLKTNPSLYISKTRLSVRQIPTFVTERLLKRLAIHSIRAFNAEVKKGEREGLTADELAEVISEKGEVKEEEIADEVDDDDDAEKTKKAKKKAFFKAGRDTGVKQAKIVRQSERVDPITGKGKSKGYGFVEMHRHSDALRFLRWANNNIEAGELFGKWWKDEVESLLKAEKAKDEGVRDEARLKRLKEELEREKSAEDASGEGGAKRKKAKGSLIVEFSIENVQVVQRRNARQTESRDKMDVISPADSKDKKRKREFDVGGKPTRNTEGSSAKKARTNTPKEEEATIKTEKPKFANPVGTIIGRKRKERKGGKRS